MKQVQQIIVKVFLQVGMIVACHIFEAIFQVPSTEPLVHVGPIFVFAW